MGCICIANFYLSEARGCSICTLNLSKNDANYTETIVFSCFKLVHVVEKCTCTQWSVILEHIYRNRLLFKKSSLQKALNTILLHLMLHC